MERIPVDFDPFRSGEIAHTAPSTEPQREIITSAFLSREANAAFNEAVSLRIAGSIDPALLESALRAIVGRHDALRMTFTRVGDELCVTDRNDFAMERLDLTGVDERGRDEGVRSLWLELVRKPMNLYEGPLFRAVWIQLGENLGELVLVAHHIVCDGWSFHIVLEELSQLCSGARAEDLGEPLSFAEFAERQKVQAVSNADVDYWGKQFESIPPVLDLPTDGPRPPYRSFAATRIDHDFNSDLVKAIASAAGKLKASVVSVVLAGTAVLLNRLTDTTDIVIGLPVARQATDGLTGLVGHAVQLLPIRLQVAEGDSFADLVGRSKTAILDASEHFNFTFGSLVRDLGLSGNPSRVPLVPVIFNIDQPLGDLRLGAATATLRTVPRTAENFEIFLNILPSKNKLVVEATFNTDLFSSETIRAWLAALESLLADGTANPVKAVAALSLSRQMPEIYSRINGTERIVRSPTWLDRLTESVLGQPDTVAVTDGKGSVTYAELARRSDDLAAILAHHGVTRGSVVGVYMTRSCELLIALAAVHKAGAAYVPLDPSFPEHRVAFMLSDSGARLLLTDLELPAALTQLQVETLRLSLSEMGGEKSAPLSAIGGADLAYVIYTSGSTGKPKGVEVMHGSVANMLESMAARPGFGRGDTLLAVTTLSFDISVLELLLPLTQGGRVIISTRDEAADARKLAGLLTSHRVTVMQATPSTWRLLLGDGWPGSEALTALCGGEPLPSDLAGALLGKVKALWNMYGPTETTVWSTCDQIMREDKQITVGRPIDNTVVYVMDSQGEPLAAGLPGEIWIGGAGVARGYHGLPELTAERFVVHPRLGRMYRTGDRGRVLSRGLIEHLGRMDDQVKVRGFRIELAEIEAVLAEHPDIQRAAVHLWTVKPGDVRIVACCIPAKAGELRSVELRKHLRARLPEYMVPQYFLLVYEIPLTPNGKIARRELPVPAIAEVRINKHEAPAGLLEVAIADMWTKLVHPARPISRTDRFFDIGGHSLLGLEVLRQIEEKFDVRLDPHVLFNEGLGDIAIRCKAGRIDKEAQGNADRPVTLPPETEILLTENQERIYRAWQADPDNLQYNAPVSFRLMGSLNTEAIADSVRAVFTRHLALRTVIGQGTSGPIQQVLPVEQMFALEFSDVSQAADPKAAALKLLDEQAERPFDLAAGPVVRMSLIKLGDQAHHFFIMPHQIIFDGWSIDIVLNEMVQNYALLEADRHLELEVPKLSYGDFTTWQRRRGGVAPNPSQLRYWQDSLRDIPPPITWPGGSDSGARVGRVEFAIERAVMDRYEVFCSAQKIRPQTLVLAAFAQVLGVALGRSDLLIGLASSGRLIPEVASLVGLFFRNLPIRMRLAEGKRAGEVLEYIQSTVQGAIDYQDIALGQLAQIAASNGSRDGFTPQVAFSYQESRNRLVTMGSLRLEEVSVSRPDLENDLEFWVQNRPAGLIASLDYRGRIAQRELVEGLRDDLVQMLERLTQSPSASIEGVVRTRFPIVGNVSQGSSPPHLKKGLFGWMRNRDP